MDTSQGVVCAQWITFLTLTHSWTPSNRASVRTILVKFTNDLHIATSNFQMACLLFIVLSSIYQFLLPYWSPGLDCPWNPDSCSWETNTVFSIFLSKANLPPTKLQRSYLLLNNLLKWFFPNKYSFLLQRILVTAVSVITYCCCDMQTILTFKDDIKVLKKRGKNKIWSWLVSYHSPSPSCLTLASDFDYFVFTMFAIW